MSVKLLDGLKIFVWIAVIGSTCAAFVAVNRSPQTELSCSQLVAVSAEDMPVFTSCDWEQRPDGANDCREQSLCTECAPVTTEPSACAQTGAFVPVPYEKCRDDDAFQPAATTQLVSAADFAAYETEAVSDAEQQAAACSAASPTWHGRPVTHDGGAPLANCSSDDPVGAAEQVLCPSAKPNSVAPPIDSTSQLQQSKSAAENLRAAATTTLTMRDQSNRAVATLTICPDISQDYMSSKERETVFAAREKTDSQPYLTGSHIAHRCTPSVDIQQDVETGHVTIDAQTIEINQLARELSAKAGRPIRCHESISGTVSARVSDVSLMRALEKLVSPFGFVLANLDGSTVIGTPEALKYEARRLEDLQVLAETQAAADAADARAAAETSPERLPPVQSVAQTAQTATVTAKSDAAVPPATTKPYEIAIGNKAKSLIAQGDLGTTAELLQEGVSRHPDSAILFRMLSEVYLHQGRFAEAQAAVEKSLTLNRQNPMANQIYGEVLKHNGQKTRATHYLEQAKYLRKQASL